MKRFILTSVLALLATFFAAGSAFATTYYVAANGSDSNSGTAKTTPWLHAPGMPGCSGTCASTTPKAGDSFILRGGDTWHTSTGSPIGLPWAWHWSGASGNSIYIGVDKTWFATSSWTRPVLTMDNPLSTSRPASCSFDDTNIKGFNGGSSSYVTFDNFEFKGTCWQGATQGQSVVLMGSGTVISNNYFHGWTYGSGSTSDSYRLINGGTLVTLNVFDGSDSSLGTTPGQASGFVLGGGTEISYNVFSHVSNGMIATPTSIHDNLFQFMYEPQGGQHGNVIETNGPPGSTTPLYFYNNIMHNTNEGVGYWPETTTFPVYFFNNVTWHWRENSNGSNGTDGSNCFMYDANTSSMNIYFINNTFDAPCNFRSLNGASPTASYQNNHYIGYSPTTTGSFGPGTDNGTELFQSEAVANGQGYVISDAYAPTLASNATVGTGSNLTSFCNGIPNANASAACKNGIVSVTYDAVNHAAVPNPVVARPGTGAWDVGAYQFGSSSSSRPAPPTGVSAVAQ